MKRQPVLRDAGAGAVGQPRRHHPPADRAERRAGAEQGPQPRAQPRLDPAAPQEKHERQQERRADQPRQQPMRPLPPIDGLELAKLHAAVQFAVLRNVLVLLELGLPRLIRHRRHHAGDRLPFDDGEAGLGQPRRAADHERQHHQRGDGGEPDADQRAVDESGIRRVHGRTCGLAGEVRDHIVLPSPPQQWQSLACPSASAS